MTKNRKEGMSGLVKSPLPPALSFHRQNIFRQADYFQTACNVSARSFTQLSVRNICMNRNKESTRYIGIMNLETSYRRNQPQNVCSMLRIPSLQKDMKIILKNIFEGRYYMQVSPVGFPGEKNC